MDREQTSPKNDLKRMVLCRSCGAEYPADIANCPYCGTMNLPAAETEYLGRLEGIRDDLEQLGSLTGRKTKTHLRKLHRNLLIGAAILALIIAAAAVASTNRERTEAEKEKSEYLWQREAFQHGRFCDALLEIAAASEALEEYEAEGGSLEWLPWLFRNEISLYAVESGRNLSAEELEVLNAKRAPLLEDFENRFRISEEEKQMFLQMLKKDGFIPIAECEKFLKEKGMTE